MDNQKIAKRFKIAMYGVIIPASLAVLSTAVVALVPGLSSMAQTDYFSCHWQAIGASNVLQFYTTPSICNVLGPVQWVLVLLTIISAIGMFIILRRTGNNHEKIGIKKYYPLIGSGAVTVIVFTAAVISNNNDVGLVGIMLAGISYLIFIYTIQIKSDYIRAPSLSPGSGFLRASRSQNPVGYWTIIVLETIAGVLIVLVTLAYFVFGTLQFN